MHLYFSNVGENLYVRNNEVLKGFAIAGADKIFIWADAKIVGNNEIVASSKSILQTIALRYALANSPIEAKLIKKEGLPAAPFRTDDWKLDTYGRINDKN